MSTILRQRNQYAEMFCDPALVPLFDVLWPNQKNATSMGEAGEDPASGPRRRCTARSRDGTFLRPPAIEAILLARLI